MSTEHIVRKIFEVCFLSTKMTFSDIKNILDTYRLDVFVNIPAIIRIDEKQIEAALQKEFLDSVKRYLNALLDLIKQRHTCSKNDALSVRSWLSTIIEALEALEDMIRLCEDLSSIYADEKSWARALATQSMVDLLESLKEEMNILRNQTRHTRMYGRIREKAFIVFIRKFSHLLDILITIMSIEMNELPTTEIVTVIGKGVGSSAVSYGAIRR